MSHLTRHYLIRGHVQGVGFRAFARARADARGLTGWTRNLADGRVEVVARGTPAALDEFARELRQGPAHGRVDDVAVSALDESTEVFETFEQRKDAAEPCRVP